MARCGHYSPWVSRFEQRGKGIAANMQYLRFLDAHVEVDLRKHPVQMRIQLKKPTVWTVRNKVTAATMLRGRTGFITYRPGLMVQRLHLH